MSYEFEAQRQEFAAHSDRIPCEEGPVWAGIGAVWRQLYGSFRGCGVSFEWHNFESEQEMDWARSFHISSVEICLNLSGSAYVSFEKEKARYGAASAGFYARGTQSLEAKRLRNECHQFITIEFSQAFLSSHLAGKEEILHPLLQRVIEGKEISGLSPAMPLSTGQQSLFASLRNPPVYSAAQPLWYEAKAMELMAQFFVQPPREQEFFCTRQKRLARERVEQVVSILRRKLAEAPPLEKIGREVGCSPFYLSRIFSKEMGVSIPQYLRQIRMEKAAQLLKSGEYNVTEAAFEVGYSSLSHFSQAFCQTMGCCPALYPQAKMPSDRSM